jgi:DNA-binding MarR family transcriptional regulator
MSSNQGPRYTGFMETPSPIRVPAHFGREFPGASRSGAEVAANLIRAADALLAEIDRRRRDIADLSPSAFQVLAILEGAGEPLTARNIAERLLVSSASTTSLLDTLERRGLVERTPHPRDRRKTLVNLSDEARDIVDRMLPVVHAAASDAVAGLSEPEREQLIQSLTSIRRQVAELAKQKPRTPKPRRKRSLQSNR